MPFASGELPARSWLRWTTLASRIGVSRTRIHEVINRLASEGLVKLSHKEARRRSASPPRTSSARSPCRPASNRTPCSSIPNLTAGAGTERLHPQGQDPTGALRVSAISHQSRFTSTYRSVGSSGFAHGLSMM
ncbi:GntR family transcriptional regulator [Arthrobacter sp. L77]|uniref:GntR family transcriptional regulator n=1 Tax=Arthrobacter sp. L77 TaxID=1496689 RepID=UPI0018CDF40F